MENLFRRAAVIGDLHFGKKNNDKQHNIDCLNFIDWFIDVAKQKQCDCIIFLGDYLDNRHSIQVATLNYSMIGLDKLNAADLPVYFLLGNHDLVYKEQRSLSSVVIAKNYNNIHTFYDITTTGNVLFCPWLVGDEWKEVAKLAKKATYVFGHFELPLFLMNAMVELPDGGGLNHRHFDDVKEGAYTGHFHKRQIKGKVTYIGNTFPHNFSDVWDDDRGMMVLEWGQRPEFISWPYAPSYRTFQLSELLDNPETSLNEYIYARVSTDIDITQSQLHLVRDIFQKHFNPRRIEINNQNKIDEQFDFSEHQELKTTDQIVMEGLSNIDSVHMDKNVLIQIYLSL